MHKFVKWFIVTAVTLSGAAIAYNFGILGLILQSDVTFLSLLIMVLFLVSTAIAGNVAHAAGQRPSGREDAKYFSSRLRLLKFLAEHFFTLGLLGTIIGFCYMMQGALVDTLDVGEVIKQLKTGMATALYTTLTGIVSSLLLQLQIFLIEDYE